MAKANGINKKLLAKKDMNFFAEFTANAAKQARMLGYGVAAGFLVVFVVLTFIIAFFIRNTIIKGQIREMDALLSSPEYSGLEQEAALLTEELNDMTNKYYALTQMRKQVDEIDSVPTDLPDVIAKCIPSDSFISSYDITNSQLTLTGYSFTYYSAGDIVNMLNDKDVFTSRPAIKIERVDLTQEESVDQLMSEDSVEAINNYYGFTISGMLVSNAHISVYRYLDSTETSTALGGVETIPVRAGSSYTIDENVSTFTYAGETYELSRIVVDGVQVEEGSFNSIKEAGQYLDVAHRNSEIYFYYVPVTADGTAEG